MAKPIDHVGMRDCLVTSGEYTMISAQRQLLLAGASALALLAGSALANSATFTGPGQQVFTAPIHGEYAIEVLGAGGGRSAVDFSGGRGAEFEGDVVLFGGQTLSVLAGGQGYSGSDGGGGGGLSLVLGPNFLAIAGGGGGAGLGGTGGPGQAGPNGQSGYGTQGGAGAKMASAAAARASSAPGATARTRLPVTAEEGLLAALVI